MYRPLTDMCIVWADRETECGDLVKWPAQVFLSETTFVKDEDDPEVRRRINYSHLFERLK